MAILTDTAFLPWCATTILSCALATQDQGLRVHVLHSADVSANNTIRLLHLAEDFGVELEFHLVDDATVAMLPNQGPQLGGRISWARLFLPEVLPDLERVVYLDADTLVVDSILPLWEMPLDDAPVAAVANVTDPEMRPRLASLGIHELEKYFNAGILIVNLEQWRRERATENLVGLVKRGDALPWFEQTALNLQFEGRWKPLHPRWNAMNSLWMWPDLARSVFGEVALGEATQHPGILHFEGPGLSKPWHFLCDHPRRDEYRSVWARTSWADVPLEDRTRATRLIARLPRRSRIPAYVGLHKVRQRVAALKSHRYFPGASPMAALEEPRPSSASPSAFPRDR